MQLFLDLSMPVRAAVAGGLVVVLLLLVVSARKRRTRSLHGAASSARPDAPDGRRSRRARRRAAAAVAQTQAQARSIPPPLVPDQPVEIPAHVEVPPVVATPQSVAADSLDPVTHAVPTARDDAAHPVAAWASVPVQDGAVAHPGWPSPGELASGFDPDAFDPLPQPHGHDDDPGDTEHAASGESDETRSDEAWMDVEPDDTQSFEAVQETWAEADDFDPATGWGNDERSPEAPAVVSGEDWTDHPELDAVAPIEIPVAVAGIPPVADADDSEAVVDPYTEQPAASEMSVWEGDQAESWVDETPPVESPAGELPSDPTAWDDEVLEDDWSAESTEEPVDVPIHWDAPDDAVADGNRPVPLTADPATTGPALRSVLQDVLDAGAPLDGATPAMGAGITLSPNGTGAPLVIDLAGLVAGGGRVDLVIEHGTNGVRLRFGTPDGRPEAGGEPGRTETADVDETSEVPETVQVTADGVDDAADHTDTPSASIETPDAEPIPSPGPGAEDIQDARVPVDIDIAVPAPAAESDERASGAAAIHAGPDQPVQPPTDLPPLASDGSAGIAPAIPATPATEPDADDPVAILADIRARLAALDARRLGDGAAPPVG